MKLISPRTTTTFALTLPKFQKMTPPLHYMLVFRVKIDEKLTYLVFFLLKMHLKSF